MHYGICNLSIVPLRIETCDKSEQVSQLLFGEHFKVLEIRKKWSKIRLSFDNYEGWIDNNQYEKIEEETYTNLEDSDIPLSGELIEFATDENQNFLIETKLKPVFPLHYPCFFIRLHKILYTRNRKFNEEIVKPILVIRYSIFKFI